MVYQSTRGGEENVSPSLAIVQGLAKDGGLFVPKEMPKLEKSLEDYANLSYQDLAYEIMKLYLTDFTEEELRYCINSAYDDKFSTKEIAPVVKKEIAITLSFSTEERWPSKTWHCPFFHTL